MLGVGLLGSPSADEGDLAPRLTGIRGTITVGTLAAGLADAATTITGVAMTTSVGDLAFATTPLLLSLPPAARMSMGVGSLFFPAVVDVPDSRTVDVDPIDRTIIVIGDDDS